MRAAGLLVLALLADTCAESHARSIRFLAPQVFSLREEWALRAASKRCASRLDSLTIGRPQDGSRLWVDDEHPVTLRYTPRDGERRPRCVPAG